LIISMLVAVQILSTGTLEAKIIPQGMYTSADCTKNAERMNADPLLNRPRYNEAGQKVYSSTYSCILLSEFDIEEAQALQTAE